MINPINNLKLLSLFYTWKSEFEKGKAPLPQLDFKLINNNFRYKVSIKDSKHNWNPVSYNLKFAKKNYPSIEETSLLFNDTLEDYDNKGNLLIKRFRDTKSHGINTEIITIVNLLTGEIIETREEISLKKLEDAFLEYQKEFNKIFDNSKKFLVETISKQYKVSTVNKSYISSHSQNENEIGKEIIPIKEEISFASCENIANEIVKDSLKIKKPNLPKRIIKEKVKLFKIVSEEFIPKTKIIEKKILEKVETEIKVKKPRKVKENRFLDQDWWITKRNTEDRKRTLNQKEKDSLQYGKKILKEIGFTSYSKIKPLDNSQPWVEIDADLSKYIIWEVESIGKVNESIFLEYLKNVKKLIENHSKKFLVETISKQYKVSTVNKSYISSHSQNEKVLTNVSSNKKKENKIEKKVKKNKSFFFFYNGIPNQDIWTFTFIFRNRKKKLMEMLLGKNPRLFKNEVFHIFKREVKISNRIATHANKLATRSKIPREKGWRKFDYKQFKSISNLLFENGQYSVLMGKDGLLTFDSDAHKKDPKFRAMLDKVMEMIINALHIGFFGMSEGGSHHFSFRCLEKGAFKANTKILYNWGMTNGWFVEFGDLKGEGGYAVSSISKNRRYNISKWWKDNDPSTQGIYTFQTRKEMEDFFAQFGIYFYSEEIKHAIKEDLKDCSVSYYRSPKNRLVKRRRKNNKTKESDEKKDIPVTSFNNSYVEKNKKNIMITGIEELKKDAPINVRNSTVSQKCKYFKVRYKDDRQKEDYLLLDGGWRKRIESIISNKSKLNKTVDLIISSGHTRDFLIDIF